MFQNELLTTHNKTLSEEQISQFQRLYKNQFGEEISKEAAAEKGAKLIQLIQAIYKPITKEEFTELKQRNQNDTTIHSKSNR